METMLEELELISPGRRWDREEMVSSGIQAGREPKGLDTQGSHTCIPLPPPPHHQGSASSNEEDSDDRFSDPAAEEIRTLLRHDHAMPVLRASSLPPLVFIFTYD